MPEKSLKHPSAERIGELRKIVDDVNPEKELDSGEVRLEVSKKELAKGLNPESDKYQEILARAINRYIIAYEPGSTEVHGGFEVLHGAVPETGIIVRKMKVLFPEMKSRETFDIVDSVEAEIKDMAEENPNLMLSAIIRKLLKENTDEKVLAVLRFKDRFEEAVSDIAKRASKAADSSLYIARNPRIKVELNEPITKRGEAMETSLGGREVIWHLLKQSLEHSGNIDKDGKAENPYLQISVHGQSVPETPDLVIGGKAGKETTLVDPEIANWFKQKLEEKIALAGAITKDGKAITVGISKEGEQYSGANPPAELRYDNERHQGFGELLQFIQLEIDSTVRNNPESREVIADILADILKDFNTEFDSADKLNRYIETNRTPEDADRLEGIYKVRSIKSPDIDPGHVGLSSRWRNVLGVKVGDTLDVSGNNFSVSKGVSGHTASRVLVFSDKENVSGFVVVKSK